MERRLIFYTSLVLFEVFVSFVGTLLPEPFTFIFYFLSFLPPLALGYRRYKKEKEEREAAAGIREDTPNFLGLSGKNTALLLPVAALTVALVFLVSYLTSLLLSALDVVGAPEYTGSFPYLLLRGAILPAMLEELLFRLLPMLLLAPYSKKWAIILPSLLFMLVHPSLYQMPYALLAGLIFIVTDLVFESVLPSIFIHLINNTVSTVWIYYINTETRVAIFASVIGAFAVVSAVIIIVFKREYGRLLRRCFSSRKAL